MIPLTYLNENRRDVIATNSNLVRVSGAPKAPIKKGNRFSDGSL